MVQDWVKTELKELMWTNILAFLMVVGVPVLALFLFGGAESSDFIEKSSFYWGFGGFAMIYILIMTFIQIMLKKKHFIGNVVLNDPEYSGILTNKQGKPYIKLKNLVFIAILLFSVLGFFATVKNEFFLVGIPAPELQVTETGNVLLSTEPASFVETILFVPLISLLLTFSYVKFFLKNKSYLHYLMIFLIIPIISGLGWLAIHSFRYAGSESSLVAVFLFGFFGSLLTCITGTPLLWWIWHFFNNAFQKMNSILSEQTILIIFIFIWIITILLWVALWVNEQNKKGSQSE